MLSANGQDGEWAGDVGMAGETTSQRNWPFPAIPATSSSTRRRESSKSEDLAPQTEVELTTFRLTADALGSRDLAAQEKVPERKEEHTVARLVNERCPTVRATPGHRLCFPLPWLLS